MYCTVTNNNAFYRMCFFKDDSIYVKLKFVNQINMSFGSGGMTCALENTHLIEYFQYLQRSFDGDIPIKRGVMGPGFYVNNDKHVFVANKSTFISADGSLIDPEQTDLVWLKRDVVVENSKVRCSDITPIIVTPLSTDPLFKLYTICEIIAKHNFIPTLLIIGCSIQCFHFECMIDSYGNCPIPVASGEAETGKSTALQAGLSLFGCHEIGLYVQASNSVLLERACSTGMYCSCICFVLPNRDEYIFNEGLLCR